MRNVLDRKAIILALVAIWLVLFLKIGAAPAQTPRGLFFKAETCCKNLRNSSKRMQLRENWLRCIEAFEAAYKEDPSGPWAPAALYKAGELYEELYRFSSRTADLKEALDIFERVSKRFQQSSYKQRADAKVAGIIRTHFKPEVQPQPSETKKEFADAEACYEKLGRNPTRMKYRENWLRCIQGLEALYQADPRGSQAAEALLRASRLYEELYRHSLRASDQADAVNLLQRVISEFPNSEYRILAERRLGYSRKLPDSERTLAESGQQTPADDAFAELIEASQAGTNPGAAPTDSSVPATVTDLRFWSNPNYTRIVIDASSETAYTHRLLNEDPDMQKPQRLYVDLNDSRLSKDASKIVPINDTLLSDVRAGQFTLDSVRIVVDIKSFKTYKIFSLKNPFRIVIDIWGDARSAGAKKEEPAPTAVHDRKIPASALAKQLALGVGRIVIDPGHGGRDYGAPGYLPGVHEKDVVLEIGRKVARKIRSELGCDVIMTRSGDKTLTLEERTAIANTENADLFVSIHTNSARNRRAYGIETYFLNLATDDESIRVAALENATSTKNISDLQSILNDLMHNAKVNESSRLAVHVQEALYQRMRSKYSVVKNKGVKQAPFYVLLGAQMPSILIETSFISNSRECKRLIDPKYQDQLTDSIVRGIGAYIKETNPEAFSRSSAREGKG